MTETRPVPRRLAACRRRSVQRSLLWILAAVLVASAVSASAVSAAPSPEARDQHGKTHRWQAPFDAVTLIDFAAYWCGPCHHSLPRLQDYAAQHPQLKVLVVSVDSSAEDRDRLVNSLGLRLPVVWDETHAIAEHYRPPAMPTSVLLAPDGEVLLVSPGSSDEEWERLVAAIEAAIEAADSGEKEGGGN